MQSFLSQLFFRSMFIRMLSRVFVYVVCVFVLVWCTSTSDSSSSSQNNVSDDTINTQVSEYTWTLEEGDVTSSHIQEVISLFKNLFVSQASTSLRYWSQADSVDTSGKESMEEPAYFLSPEGENMNITVQYSRGHTQDTLTYTLNATEQSIVFPYSIQNVKKLESEECADETLFDSILCYMPRVNAVFWPYEGVFGSGKQLVYTVSSYQGMSTQHVLDLPSQTPLPSIDGLTLLFALDTRDDEDTLVAAMEWNEALYHELFILREGEKVQLRDQPYDMISYNGDWIIAGSIDYSTMQTDIFLYNIADRESLLLENIFVWLKSEFMVDDQVLYSYYVDVSFIDEKEEYYIQAIDMQWGEVLWKIRLEQAL